MGYYVNMKFTEADLQNQVADYLRAQYPTLLWFHTANERKCTPQKGARLKRAGVLAGVSDILIFWNGGMGAIELKAGKNTMQPTQHDFANHWRDVGGKFACCYNLDEVMGALRSWGING